MHVCRDCSAAFHLAPYQGKYPAPHAAPDPLEMQKLLAGMADRGADVAVVECESDGLAVGRCAADIFMAMPIRSMLHQHLQAGWGGHAQKRLYDKT